jgi:hypothetical protein
MSRKTLHTCDRCNAEEFAESMYGMPTGWEEITLKRPSGYGSRYQETLTEIEVCTDCLKKLQLPKPIEGEPTQQEVKSLADRLLDIVMEIVQEAQP